MQASRILAWLVLAWSTSALAAESGSPPASAASASGAKPDAKAPDPSASQNGAGKSNGNATNPFTGWAVGLAVVKPKISSVGEATVVDGKVRSSSSASQEASILVSNHIYPFAGKGECEAAADGTAVLDAVARRLQRCVGLMVGVGLGTAGGSGDSQLINFAGIGLSIGGPPTGNKRGWHLGLGIGRKFNVKTLGDGFKEGEPPPGTESQVRYKTIDTSAKFIYISTDW